MNTTAPRQSRANAVRIIAACLCLDTEPPIIRNLTKARAAAGEIYGALVAAGILAEDDNDPAGDEADGVDVPLFPPNGLADVEA